MGPELVFPLTLSCQLSVPEPVEPARTLGRRIGLRGDTKTFAEELSSPTQKILTLFPQPPLENHVHIMVELPSSEPMVVILTIANWSRLPCPLLSTVVCHARRLSSS